MSRYSALWVCVATVENQKNVKEEGKLTKENKEERRRNAEGREGSCFSDCT